MKASEVKIGLRVKDTHGGIYKIIVENVEGNPQQVIVEPEKGWYNGGLRKHSVKELTPYPKEQEEEEARIAREKQEQIEREWQATLVPITEKINAAVALIEEANKLASQKGHTLNDLCEVADTLEYAMEEVGWNTSSWHC